MRRPIVAGNWKMNKTAEDAETLARAVIAAVADEKSVEVVICPPYIALERVARVVAGSSVGLGAQNMHWEADGAFTGEVSSGMLLTCGCKYVILGHSERRQFFGETDFNVNKRLKTALKVGLKPIVCVGETLEERTSDVTDQVVRKQVTGGLEGISGDQARGLVLAYEPVWAIGTGLTASPEQAEAVHAMIRQVLVELYSDEIAQSVRLQYGGSVKPGNAADLFGQPNIDGGLIGGAALDADSFAAIVHSAA
ncbi:MAG: triose-phosphate isomerase [bacterium]|jgi:triosephosphate isomerase (TIM)|nr:triose-phosphate isomerase [bacterium]